MKSTPRAIAAASLPPVLTVDELATLLRMNRKTAYEAIARNDIPGVQRIGRQFRISRDAVLGWLGGSTGPVARGPGATP